MDQTSAGDSLTDTGQSADHIAQRRQRSDIRGHS